VTSAQAVREGEAMTGFTGLTRIKEEASSYIASVAFLNPDNLVNPVYCFSIPILPVSI
jgi:hypothetical protein